MFVSRLKFKLTFLQNWPVPSALLTGENFRQTNLVTYSIILSLLLVVANGGLIPGAMGLIMGLGNETRRPLNGKKQANVL